MVTYKGTSRFFARNSAGKYQLDVQEIRAAFRMLDYSQYGGAPLLGVKGVSIICHGSSNANAQKED